MGCYNWYSEEGPGRAAHHDLTFPRSRLARYGSRSFVTSGPSIWNSLQPTLRDSTLTFTAGFLVIQQTKNWTVQPMIWWIHSTLVINSYNMGRTNIPSLIDWFIDWCVLIFLNFWCCTTCCGWLWAYIRKRGLKYNNRLRNMHCCCCCLVITDLCIISTSDVHGNVVNVGIKAVHNIHNLYEFEVAQGVAAVACVFAFHAITTLI